MKLTGLTPQPPQGSLGTAWTEPGNGATVAELAAALGPEGPPPSWWIEAIGADTKTGLNLTGSPVQFYDGRRILEHLAELLRKAR